MDQALVPCLLVTMYPLGLFPDISAIGAAVERAAKPARAIAQIYFIIASKRIEKLSRLDEERIKKGRLL